jgi:hypothetical protein
MALPIPAAPRYSVAIFAFFSDNKALKLLDNYWLSVATNQTEN